MRIVLALLSAILFTTRVNAEELKVIVNPKVELADISTEDMRALFLGTKTTLKNVGHLQPVLPKSGPARATLAQQYLGKTDAGLETYYRSLVFSGRWSMPPTLNTDADIVSYVAKTPGTIACIHENALTAGVKVVRLR